MEKNAGESFPQLRDADLRAGDAVAAGALVAGPLSKRSDWLHSWNKRFCILTTEELAWQRDPGANATSEWRTLSLLTDVKLFVRDGGSTLVIQAEGAAQFFRAASEPELRMWHSQMRNIVEALQAEGRVARLHMRESQAHFATPFLEMPHIGSRNHRARTLDKLFYSCHRRQVVGEPLLPIEGSEVCMYLMALPALSAAWTGQQRRAFRELLDALAAVNHPFLLGSLRADILPDVLRAAVYRPFVSRGSLKDLIHNVTNPRDAYGLKYGTFGRSCAVTEPSPAGPPPSLDPSSPSRRLSSSPGGKQSGRAPPSPLPLPRVVLFSRQLLEAITFLHSIGMRCSSSSSSCLPPPPSCLLPPPSCLPPPPSCLLPLPSSLLPPPSSLLPPPSSSWRVPPTADDKYHMSSCLLPTHAAAICLLPTHAAAMYPYKHPYKHPYKA